MSNRLKKLSMDQAIAVYRGVVNDSDAAAMRELALTDLFFLLTVCLRRVDAMHPWIYARCREVEANPDGMLDLWAREHYKSTIITFAKTIQDILANPDLTVGIFSHTRPIAKDFLRQIKREFEDNEVLKELFPDVLYAEPRKEAASWSVDNGITVKRNSNPREATVEAWGIVDGQPIGKHFSLLVYDDVVTRESVNTPEMIAKTNECWGLSLSLGAAGGTIRYIGTRYHFNDTYRAIMEAKAATPRIYPATDDGTAGGKPVFMDAETLNDRRKGGTYVFACQYCQNPLADSVMGFKEEWLKYYNAPAQNMGDMNIYITVDPAHAKKRENDYTVMTVIGLAPDNNYYLLDAVRDRLGLTERTEQLFKFVREYRPLAVGYERYGLQADVEHVKDTMERENYRFNIIELGGNMPKDDRIRKMVPLFEFARFHMPLRLMFIDREKKQHDFTREFVRDEYTAFPVGTHDDMLDCLARIVDPKLKARFPEHADAKIRRRTPRKTKHYRRKL